MKKFLWVLCVIAGFIFLTCATDYLHLIDNIPELDLSAKENGTYRGEYDLKNTPINVVLDVNVQNSRISEIKIIEHKRSPVGKKAENIISQIINQQNLHVDVVSGATASSVAIIKAVENALE